ncbi:MAG: hypothetical protein NTX66_02305 [Candidatus Falkowbacteria bacterium]|nr:hypothetical protein [Candidatus Falkowbacteria bacterium]
MKSKNYKIKNLTLILRDEASVKFHVKNDDYFGTIATIISLLKQEVRNHQLKNQTKINAAFKNLEKDLMFLQRNYQISLKADLDKSIDKTKLKAKRKKSPTKPKLKPTKRKPSRRASSRASDRKTLK